MATALVNARQACIRDVTVIDPATSILDAARRMRERHVGCLVVTWDAVRGRMPVGVLTDRDIVTAIVAKRRTFHPRRCTSRTP